MILFEQTTFVFPDENIMNINTEQINIWTKSKNKGKKQKTKKFLKDLWGIYIGVNTILKLKWYIILDVVGLKSF